MKNIEITIPHVSELWLISIHLPLDFELTLHGGKRKLRPHFPTRAYLTAPEA